MRHTTPLHPSSAASAKLSANAPGDGAEVSGRAAGHGTAPPELGRLDEPHLLGSPVAEADVERDDPDVVLLGEARGKITPRYRLRLLSRP